MKILFPYNDWKGSFLKSIEQAFEKMGHEIVVSDPYTKDWALKNKFFNQIVFIKDYWREQYFKEHNKNFVKSAQKLSPDLLLTKSGGLLAPQTIKEIKASTGCKTMCIVSDNPFDPWRDKYFGLTLHLYDYILVPERIWIQNIRNVAPHSEIIFFIGGYDNQQFYPVNTKDITQLDIKKFECEISFTGGSYGDLGEGNYRARVLSQLEKYNLRIWGDRGWYNRGLQDPTLGKAYQGDRLSYEDLRKLYTICKVNINMPSPQIFTSFQPRTFDIAATKGFQIVDYRNEISNFFSEDDLVTFKNTNDLKDKITYYLNHEDEREIITENLYNKIVKDYTWENQIIDMMNKINI